MKNTIRPSHILRSGLFITLTSAGLSHGAVLYTISSFEATPSTVNTPAYDVSVVSISTAAGLTGTTAAQLASLQTVNPNATIDNSTPRFQNNSSDVNRTPGTLITDASTTNYFQFGVSGGAGAINLTDLTFNAKQATANAAGRGYVITASVDGGSYSQIAAASLTKARSDTGFDNIIISLSDTAYQNISSIDFRVRSVTGGVEYADFTVNGAVPEPSSALLTALTGIGLLALRRRK